MFENKYAKIAILAAALLLIAVILIFALGRDSALFPDRGDNNHPNETTAETTYGTFDDSNVGEWN